ncbi:MAG: uncharacterized protein QOE84_1635 [Actinomycetota bacterium]|jgi:uncharacterized OB-fold protein|nr:uncharacterized protein [Actinomycetota bacterium]
MTAPAKRRFDLPTVEPETQPFWDAAREGRLLIRRCAACGTAHSYPRPFCPVCWSEDVPWEQASGRATLYTFSTVFLNDLPPFSERLPYVAAVVDLEEGPRMMTGIVDAEPADLVLGMRLEVTFRPLDDDLAAPYFRPAATTREDT